ncbi:hypothetical protein LXA53_17595, partial [Erwinia amylovora]|nr:hypothetical protein [Erwinia amylovora]
MKVGRPRKQTHTNPKKNNTKQSKHPATDNKKKKNQNQHALQVKKTYKKQKNYCPDCQAKNTTNVIPKTRLKTQ